MKCDHALYYDDGHRECPDCGEFLGEPKFSPGWVAQQFGMAIDFNLVGEMMQERWEQDVKIEDLRNALDSARAQIRSLKRKIKKLEHPSLGVLRGRRLSL